MVHKPEKGIDIEDIAEIRPGFEAFLFSIQDPMLNPADEGFAVSIIGNNVICILFFFDILRSRFGMYNVSDT